MPMPMRRFALALICLLFVVDLVVGVQLWRAWQDRSGAQAGPTHNLHSANGVNRAQTPCLPGALAPPKSTATCR